MPNLPFHPEPLTEAVELAFKLERRSRLAAGRRKSSRRDQQRGNEKGRLHYEAKTGQATSPSNFKRMKSQELARWHRTGKLKELLPGERRELVTIKQWIGLETDELRAFEEQILPTQLT